MVIVATLEARSSEQDFFAAEELAACRDCDADRLRSAEVSVVDRLLEAIRARQAELTCPPEIMAPIPRFRAPGVCGQLFVPTAPAP